MAKLIAIGDSVTIDRLFKTIRGFKVSLSVDMTDGGTPPQPPADSGEATPLPAQESVAEKAPTTDAGEPAAPETNGEETGITAPVQAADKKQNKKK